MLCAKCDIYLIHTGYPDSTNATGDNQRRNNNKAAKKCKYPFFLIWTAMTRIDFSSLYRKKGGCIFVLFLFLFLLFSAKPGF